MTTSSTCYKDASLEEGGEGFHLWILPCSCDDSSWSNMTDVHCSGWVCLQFNTSETEWHQQEIKTVNKERERIKTMKFCLCLWSHRRVRRLERGGGHVCKYSKQWLFLLQYWVCDVCCDLKCSAKAFLTNGIVREDFPPPPNCSDKFQSSYEFE